MVMLYYFGYGIFKVSIRCLVNHAVFSTAFLKSTSLLTQIFIPIGFILPGLFPSPALPHLLAMTGNL